MAKTLYLVRHAKSGWTDMRLSDFDRPINQRGLHDAPEMGRRLRQRGVSPEVILCSPAQRARQTAELLVEAFGGSLEAVQFDDRIYEASNGTLLNIIQSLPDTCSSVMVIGHNPAIGYLVHQFSDTGIERMPTCAIATLQHQSQTWNDFGRDSVRLVDFDYPKNVVDR